MALPLIPIVITGVIRAAPWVIGYLITDKVADTIRPPVNSQNDKVFAKTDLQRVLEGSLSVPALARTNFTAVPSASNNGFGDSFGTKDIFKLALLSGAAYAGFKALQEGKKLI